MKFEKGDIVTTFCVAGEITGKLVKMTDTTIELDDPRVLMQDERGQVGYAKGVCVSGQTKPQNVTINQYLFVIPTNDEFRNAYLQTVTGLVL